MAVMAGVLNETQRRTLEAVCDTFVPSIEMQADDPVIEAFFARAASDMGVAGHVEGLMAQAMMPEDIARVTELLDALAEHRFADQPLEARTQALKQTAESSPEARLGVRTFRTLALFFYYGLPDERGANPNWPAIGYPGPPAAPPSPEEAPKTIPLEHVSGESATMTADVCVVGSGAGGGVIAAELQRAGKSVVVLEMGNYHNESDFKGLELPALLEMYLGAGLLATEDGSMALLAGSTLGGGTTVNWLNSIRTPPHILREWAEHGLEGLDRPEYSEHLDAVWDRLGVNAEATTQNRAHQKLIAALDSLGLSHKPITRNADPGCDDPRVCGHCGWGCSLGCKQGTMRTYLQDAADAGARFVVSCRAERVLAEDGRATGVEATVTHADGATTKLTVAAPTVVVAGGSIESPALLLRSAIGGPAVGKHLRLHPASLVMGVYDDPIEGWDGQIQSEISYAFADCEGQWGFLVESSVMSPVFAFVRYPWEDGRRLKQDASNYFKWSAPFISVARDHGEGEVTIDGYGRPLVRWGLNDEVDRRMFVRANVELAKLHHAAGAKEMFTSHEEPTRWRQGEDFDRFLETIEGRSYEPNHVAIGSAHQMGSCRMGADPADSVADGRGELHETKGVWIGDASAFPTAPGVNPMISIMALAHRTASQILSADGAG